MMDDPGSFSGSMSSPRPHLGPDASKRMSLTTFMRDTAIVLSAPDTSTMASWQANASNLLGAVSNGMPRNYSTKLVRKSS